jgi:hypothetical protein
VTQSPNQGIKPPQPPEIPRRIHLYPYQWVGFLCLFLIPVLALFGVFGETRDVAQIQANGIELTVMYTNRVHFHAQSTTRILVRNTQTEVMPAIQVAIDRSLLDNYAELTFMPGVAEITASEFVIQLTGIPPGETRVILLNSRGKIPGFHQGMVTASAGEEQITVKLEVFIFP